jgi:molybdenum cofactor synthesis domain-containing protein
MQVSVLTVSDRCSKEKIQDISGKLLCDILKKHNFKIASYEIVADEAGLIENKLTNYCDKLKVDFVFTTGGTGLSLRDVTPEATASICDKLVPGISEYIRLQSLKYTKKAILSRAVCGARKNTIIINLPGSPKAVEQTLKIILDILPHALDMLKGRGH